MKALQLTAPKKWQLIRVAPPEAPGPGDVLLKVHRVGVCGTDIAGYLGKFPYFSYPRIPGHELGVEVVAIGEGVNHLNVGDRCSVEPYLNCQRCYSCMRGHTNCCEHNQTLGVMCDGGLTEYIILPARKVHPANQLSFEQAALVETLAIGCHAVNRARVTEHDTVLVLGAGPIGLAVLEFVKLSGARPIVADLSQKRLEFVATRMDVSSTLRIVSDDSDIRRLEEMTDGKRADVVIDATGNHKSMSYCLNYAAFAGRITYVGITQQNLEFPHATALHRRELTILASRNALPDDFARIIQLIGSGRINTDTWITHHARFEEVPDAFPGWTDPDQGILKAIIHVD